MEKSWEGLTSEEKRAERIKPWIEPSGIKFVSPEAEEAYRTRMKRLADVYQLKEPDRVPVDIPYGDLPLKWAGLTIHDAMYDYDLLRRIWKKFLTEFEMDSYRGPGMVLPGRVYDLVGCRLYKWPGNGLPVDSVVFQYAEGEYMMADEYDALIRDPSDFWMRTYLPRVFGVFESYRNIQPYTNIIELPGAYFASYGRPDVQASLRTLIDAGNEYTRYQGVILECVKEASEAGIPSPPRGGGLKRLSTLSGILSGALRAL